MSEMELRDYIAIQVFARLSRGFVGEWEKIAPWSYQAAEVLMAERERILKQEREI